MQTSSAIYQTAAAAADYAVATGQGLLVLAFMEATTNGTLADMLALHDQMDATLKQLVVKLIKTAFAPA